MCENSMKFMTFHVIKPMGLHWEIWNLTLPIVFEELYLRAQMEFGGVL